MFVQINDDEFVNIGCIRHIYLDALGIGQGKVWHVEMADGDEYTVSEKYTESFLAAVNQMLMPATPEIA